MTPHSRYPSDLSDARWALIEPVLTSWHNQRRARALDIGRPAEHELRQIVNAILYMDRTGIPWRCLPHDFALWATVYGHFAKWRQDGVFEQFTGLLRHLVREAEGRRVEPSSCVLDSRTIKTSTDVHLADQGTGAGKRIIGRKRHLGRDTLGLLPTVPATAVGVTLPSHIAASASMSTPTNARPAPAGSRSSRDAAPSNAASAGSCTAPKRGRRSGVGFPRWRHGAAARSASARFRSCRIRLVTKAPP
ncbi:MAG TPA: transposase [Streptomyces sp.]